MHRHTRVLWELVMPSAARACPRAKGTFALSLAMVRPCSQRLVKLMKLGKEREGKGTGKKHLHVLCLLRLVALLSSWGFCEHQFSCDQTNELQHDLKRLELSGLLAVSRYLVLTNV